MNRKCERGGRRQADCRSLLWLLGTVTVVLLLLGSVRPTLAVTPLPARPTLVPTLVPTAPPQREAGAHIVLQAVGAPRDAWGVVQWQDTGGGWHEVEGWRGKLPGGRQRWWVATKDLGTGPFRWVVTHGPGGPLWGVSQSFTLPDEGRTTLYTIYPSVTSE